MTIKTVHDVFAFIAVVVPWALAAIFLAVVGLLFRREQECAAPAETGERNCKP
jgi:NADH:ubiquinone oxidoreductase subunit K